jgi:hypothetical protein
MYRNKLTRRIAQKIMIQKRIVSERGLRREAKSLHLRSANRAKAAAAEAEQERLKRLAWEARKQGGGWTIHD